MTDQQPIAQGGASVARLKALLSNPAVVFGLLFVLAYVLRKTGVDGGLPYCWHPDEPKLINKGLEMLQNGDWNPHWFHYPSLPIYIQAVGAALGYLDHVGSADFIPLADIPTGTAENLVHTVGDPNMWARGRKITALMGSAAVGVTYLAGRRLFGPLAGILAALFLALSPLHITHSAYITVDVPTSLGAAAVLLASAWIYTEGQVKHYLWGAACLGLMIGFKYNAAVGALVPLAAWLLSEKRGERLFWGVALVPLGLVVFVLTMPFALVEVSTALTDMALEVNHYMVRGHGNASIEPGLPHLAAMLRVLAVDGLPVWLLGVLLLPFGIRGRWKAVAVAAILPVAYLGYMSGSAVFFKRNAVVLLPAFALLAGAGFQGAWGALKERVGDRSTVVGGIGLAVLLVPGGLAVRDAVKARQNRVDSRSEAIAWVASEHPDWVLAVPVELRIAPADLATIEHVEVKFNDGEAGWRKAGATHVLGATRIKVSGTRNTPIKGKATDRAKAWFASQEPLQTWGYAGWMLDLNAQNPELSVYALGDGAKASPGPAAAASDPSAAPPPVADAGELDAPENWQVKPDDAVERGEIEFKNDKVFLYGTTRVKSVKVCSAQRVPVDGPVTVSGRWAWADVSRENMAAQIQLRYFTLEGAVVEGSTPETKGIQVVAQGVGGSNWVDIEHVATPPPGAAKVRVCVEVGADAGSVRVDDLRVQ